MLHQLSSLVLDGVQMIGVGIILIGGLMFAGAIFSSSITGFIKSGALILIGAYLAGLAGSFYP